MKGATIKWAVTKALIFAKRASPYILAALSAGGTIGVAVEAIKEIKKHSPKVIYVKSGEEVPKPEETEEDTACQICVVTNNVDIYKHKIMTAVKTYYKPVLFCTASLTALAGSVFIFNKRQQALIIATYQMENLLQKYTNAALATAGVGGTAILEKYAPTSSADIPEAPPFNPDDDGKMLFWDPYFDDGYSTDGNKRGYYFRATEADFQDAAKRTMHCFVCNGIDTIENFYLRMNVPPPVDKNLNSYKGWGWIWNETYVMAWQEYSGNGIFIDYSEIMHTDDGMEYRIVRYDKPPWWDQDILDDPNVKNYLYYNFM